MSTSFAFVFPGQGSQKISMLDSYADEAIVQQTFEQASHALNQNLWTLSQSGPESQLNDTQWTQPLLLTAAVALWRLWQQSTHLIPKAIAGHSLGEYSALVCAGALDFEQAVKLVQKRGQLMQQAVPNGQGAMAAILGLEKDKVIELCQQVTQGVCEAVNFNSPEQTVVAGEKQAVEAMVTLAKENGAKRALVLPVSVPSHCRLMHPAAKQLADYIKAENIVFSVPEITLLHNVDVTSHQTHDEIQQALVQQLAQPVRWVETIQALADMKIDTYVECGPGKVLGGLIKRIHKGAQVFTLESKSAFDQAKENLS